MRLPADPSRLYRSVTPHLAADPSMAALVAFNAACVFVLLAALSPFLAVSGVFAGAVCLLAVRDSR